MEINDPVVMAEVTEAFERYERALIENDLPTLLSYFRDDPGTIRYGLADAQYGFAEIQDFRRSTPVAAPPRTLHRTMVAAFGADVAVVNTEFVPDGSGATGRQSQTWLRTVDGWKIVSAHVSWSGGQAP